MKYLTISRLAKAAGASIDTVRFYERARLLREPPRSTSGYRRYGDADIARIRFIRRAKALGFSLEEIRELLRLNDGKGSRSAVRALAERRLVEVDRRLSDLQSIRRALGELVAHCRGDGDLKGCPIIEAVVGDAAPSADGGSAP